MKSEHSNEFKLYKQLNYIFKKLRVNMTQQLHLWAFICPREIYVHVETYTNVQSNSQ